MADEKFKNLVHFVVHNCKDNPGRLGATRLNKVLWFTDVIAYKANGVPMTSEAYKRRKNGPVPAHILAALEELKTEGKLAISEPEHQYDSRKFISLVLPETKFLSEEERSMTIAVLEAICGVTANKISEITHDAIWKAAKDGEEIPLFATLASEIGSITDEVKAWGNSIYDSILNLQPKAVAAASN